MQTSNHNQPLNRYWHLLVLIFAGEIIFSLPFHIARFFRPTFLEVYQLSNTQLGDVFAVYGVAAMLAYFPGGTIADHFSPRKLMSFSLFMTALGGIYLHSIPSVSGLYLVFGYFGVTTILLFWAAMIKATRLWGGNNAQGVAFGLLDGGRGLVASLAASLAVFIFSLILADQLNDAYSQKQAIQSVILFYISMTLLAAIIVWLIIPVDETNNTPKENNTRQESITGDIFQVIRNKTVWLQGGIIVAAYCGYKSLDNYGIYAVEILQMDAVESAQLTALGSYTRPFAAILAGIIADRWSSSKMVMTLFAICAIAFSFLIALSPQSNGLILILANLMITFIAVFALRGIYFSLIEESRLKANLTGTAVGLISLVGYTPDIFFGSLSGRILDANPGLAGFQNYFLLLASIAVIGLFFSYLLSRQINTSR